jgi:ADP-ribosylglycohydrolase
MIQQLVAGDSLTEALGVACRILEQQPRHEETLTALVLARSLGQSDTAPELAIEQLGLGWIAEEALAISVYCAMKADTFRDAIEMAVNHDGDSDSTGAITGNLLGALWGEAVIPERWREPLELGDVIREMADDLYGCRRWNLSTGGGGKDEEWVWEKYPGY